MAKIIASTMGNSPFSGEDGNRSASHGKHVLAAAAIADTVDLVKIPAGTKLFEAVMVTAALGASTTISLGFRNADGSATSPADVAQSATALLAATSTAAAAKTRSLFAPITFTQDAILYATVAGAAATGQLDVVTDYEYVGMK